MLPRREAGITLIEILLGAGLLAVVALGLSSMQDSSKRSAAQLQAGTSFNDTLSLVGGLLDRPEACTQALQPLNLVLAPPAGPPIAEGPLVPPVPLPTLGLPGRPVIRLGEITAGHEVTKLEFDRVLQSLGNGPQIGGTHPGYLVRLSIQARRVNAPDLTPLSANLLVAIYVDAGNRIRACDCPECPIP